MRRIVTTRRPWRSKALAVGVFLVGVFLAGIILAACQQIELMMADSEGERLWLQHCARCHGRDGAGNTPRYMGQPYADLIDDHWRTGGDRVALEDAIRNGRFGEMPAFEELSREEVREIIRYLRELRGERRKR